MHNFQDLVHGANVSSESVPFFREILKASFIAVAKPGISGKSQKMKVGMFPKSKAGCTV